VVVKNFMRASKIVLSKYHQILKSNYKSEEKEGWKDLSYSDRQTLESAEIKRNCTGAESYGSIPYDPYANDRKKEKKKSKWSRLSLYERRQYLIDSINLKTGTSYDTVARFLITPFEFWSCGLLKKRNRIDIINSEGKVIYKTKAAAIPKSITSGKLFMVNSVFVKGAKERVIIQDDETISPADQYHDLHYTNSFVLAFLDAEEAYPLHLFDAKGKKVFDSDVYGLTRSNRALIKKPNGEYAIRGIFGKMETLDGVEFDLIELTGEKTKAPLQLKDKIPREYVEENGNPPFLDHDYLAGYRDTKYSKHKVLLDLFDTSNSRNRKRSKVQSPNFYSTNHPRGKRLVALVGNTVHLDTVVQKLVAVKADSKAIVAEIDGQVKEILLTNQKRSFFKQKHRGTEMYITSKGDSISLRSASGKVIQTTAANSRGAYLQMTPNQVMNDRHILHLNNEESVLLDDQGHTLHIIKKMNPNWIVTSAAHPEMHSPLDFQLIGKTFLKVYHPKPYLINLETMKVFRSD